MPQIKGRKRGPKWQGRDLRAVMIRITPEMSAILERISEEKDWTLARVARMLLADGLREYLHQEAVAADALAKKDLTDSHQEMESNDARD